MRRGESGLYGVLSGIARRVTGRRRTVHAAFYEHVLGTSLEMRLEASGRRPARAAELRVLEEIERLAAIFSRHAEDSELLRWCRTFGEPVRVSTELAEVLREAGHWARLTSGAFDPTAGEMAAGPANEPANDRSWGAEIASEPLAFPPTWWSVHDDPPTATRLTSRPIDLDGIAKGYIIDQACSAALAVAGVRNAMVNIGGDLRHIGDRPFRVGITDPRHDAENAEPLCSVTIRDQGLATSGGYRRGIGTQAGLRSHVRDSRTGTSADRILSASVFAPTAVAADALATAFNVVEPTESIELADSLEGVGCAILAADGTFRRSESWIAQELSVAGGGPG